MGTRAFEKLLSVGSLDAFPRRTVSSLPRQVMVLATFLGTLASLSLVRGRYQGKQLWYAFILSPIIIPVIISAISAYFFLAKLKLIGTIPALVLPTRSCGPLRGDCHDLDAQRF